MKTTKNNLESGRKFESTKLFPSFNSRSILSCMYGFKPNLANMKVTNEQPMEPIIKPSGPEDTPNNNATTNGSMGPKVNILIFQYSCLRKVI